MCCIAYKRESGRRRIKGELYAWICWLSIAAGHQQCSYDKVSHYLPTQTHTRWPRDYAEQLVEGVCCYLRRNVCVCLPERRMIWQRFIHLLLFPLSKWKARERKLVWMSVSLPLCSQCCVILVLWFIIRAAPSYLNPSLWARSMCMWWANLCVTVCVFAVCK